MCNCNNSYNNCEDSLQTACHKCTPKPCVEPQDCSCPTILKTDCVTFEGNDLACSGIKKGTILTELIQQLDAFICKVREDLINAFTLRNIGTGAEVYKGVDILGRKEIRKINATGDLVSVTQNTDDISVSINETNLDTFIENNQKTYTVANVGTGAQAYKDSTVVGNNTQYNFRTVVKEDLGNGVSFLRDIQENTNELNVRVKTFVSDNLTITSTNDEVRVETPMTASIPALYVNNLYIPSYPEWLAENSFQNGGTPLVGFVFKGRGTLSAPFCDDIVYPLAGGSPTITPNTAIQNSLDGDSAYAFPYSYVGTGTRLIPDRVGEKIIVQDNNTQYNYTGDFGYSRINIEINANLNSTILGYVVDMDNATHFNSLSDIASITIGNRYILYVNGNGFNNSGTNIATNTSAQTRGIVLLGSGTIFAPGTDITKYVINSDITSTGNNNDGGLTYDIRCNIRASYQGITKIGGLSRIWNFGTMQSGYSEISVNTLLKAHLLLGGQFLNFEGSSFSFGSTRTDGILFTPTGGFTPRFICQSTRFQVLDIITNLFNKTNNNVAILNVTNSDSGVYLNITNVFESTNLWSVYFNQNIFETGNINPTKADLTNGNTTSVINSIGTNLIENLVIYDNRASAVLAGVPLYSAYIKTNGNAYPSTATWVRDIVLPA